MRYIGRKEQKWAGAKQRLLQDMSHMCKGGGVQRAKATEGRVAAYNLGTWSFKQWFVLKAWPACP